MCCTRVCIIRGTHVSPTASPLLHPPLVPADSRFVSSILATLYPPRRPYIGPTSRIYSATALSRNGFFFQNRESAPPSPPPLPRTGHDAAPSHPPTSPPLAPIQPYIRLPTAVTAGKKCFEFLESPRLVSVSIVRSTLCSIRRRPAREIYIYVYVYVYV